MTTKNNRFLWKLVHQNAKAYVDPRIQLEKEKQAFILQLNTAWYGRVKALQYQLWDRVVRNGWK